MSYILYVAPKANWKEWKERSQDWSSLLSRLQKVKRTPETMAQYARMSKPDKLRTKDAGGFVAGRLRDGVRKLTHIESRSLIVLDADTAQADFWDVFKAKFPGLRAVVHTTHSSTPEKPRYRLIIALDREFTISEHEIAAHYITATLGQAQFDDTTYEPHRLMFWPSVPADGAYFIEDTDGEPLKFEDVPIEWHDASNWPSTKRRQDFDVSRTMEDPRQKPSFIGAFCRLFDIHQAIEEFLPGVYIQSDDTDRYTYAAGSTANGMQVFDDIYAYSHHATDPAGQRGLNAWDLVRLHLFGALDNDEEIDKAPSQQSMREMVMNREDVVAEMVRSRMEEAQSAFDDEDETTQDWRGRLDLTDKGTIANTRRNLFLILMNDPGLKDGLGINLLTRRLCKFRPLPWDKNAFIPWRATADIENLHMYLEGYQARFTDEKVKGALEIVAHRKSYHPVADLLSSLKWDGVERAERLLVDYAGAADTPYTRAVTKAWLLGAVTRAMRPGATMQYMLLLTGPQGIGKSMFLRALAMRPEWFSDRVHKMDASKEAIEAIMGKWIIEVGELAAMRKGLDEQEAIKAFISADSDYYRTPYATYAEDVPRSCVFAGTSNELDILRDVTGGRRFWPVGVRVLKRGIPAEQIWAEAVTWYLLGEEPFLSPEMEKAASEVQENYREEDERVGMIEEFLELGVPPRRMDIDELREWYQGPRHDAVPREVVCGAEIFTVLFGRTLSHYKRIEQRDVSQCLRSLKGWEPSVGRMNLHPFGRVRPYLRQK